MPTQGGRTDADGRVQHGIPETIEKSTTGGSRPSGGGVEENPLKSCLSVSRVETGTPGGGGCVLVRHVS